MSQALPQNRASFELAELAHITSGTLHGERAGRVSGVVTDTRADVAGRLFVALRGERFDAHVFAEQAARAGAAALLVDRDVGELGVPIVRVASTSRALLELAAAHRRRWSGRVIAVAGSAGKTTTRSAISSLLARLCPGRVHFAAGNFNNRVGVPLVLLGLEPEHDLAVLEIGTNATGEVAELTRVAAPDVGVLTLIGIEHAEGLGSLEQIELEEGSLLRGLREGAAAVGNSDDERVLRQLGRATAARRVGYGFAANADYRVLGRRARASGSSDLCLRRPAVNQRVPGSSPTAGAELEFECALVGRAGAYAATCAVAVSELVLSRSLSAEDVGTAFAAGGEPGRLRPVELADGMLVLDDTYNSNPASLVSSVAAAAELSRLRGGRLLLVLGEMRELGHDSARLHSEAGEAIRDAGAAFALGVNGDARHLIEPLAAASEIAFVADAEAAMRELSARLQPKDVILVKASRGVRAERIVNELCRTRGVSA